MELRLVNEILDAVTCLQIIANEKGQPLQWCWVEGQPSRKHLKPQKIAWDG